MSDRRYDEALARLKGASDRAAAIRSLAYDDIILALAATSRTGDGYLANVLASELLNRTRRGVAVVFSAGLGVAAGIMLLFVGGAFLARHPHNFSDHVFLILAAVVVAVAAVAAWIVHPRILTRLLDRRV